MFAQDAIRSEKPRLIRWLSPNPNCLMDALDSKAIITRDVYRTATDQRDRITKTRYLLDQVIDSQKAHELMGVLNELKDDYPQLQKWLPLCFCSLTINRNSVNQWLQCDANGRTLRATELRQDYPDHRDRFAEWKVALCTEGFSSGRHFWEACVEQAQIFRAGIAYEKISRRGSECETWLGRNRASWCLCRRDDDYFVAHNGIETSLKVRRLEKHKIRVLLDMEQGSLSFYDGNLTKELHVFRIERFEDRVYPAFMVGKGSLTIEA